MNVGLWNFVQIHPFHNPAIKILNRDENNTIVMDVIILNSKKENKHLLPIEKIKKLSNVLSAINIDNINKVYILYAQNDNSISDFLSKKQDYKFNIISKKLDKETDEFSILSKINYLVETEKIKNDIAIITFNCDLSPEFSNLIDYFEAIKKPIILLKTTQKKLISKNNEIVLDKDGFVKTIIEHPLNPKSKITSSGVYFIPKDALFWIKKISNTGANKTSLDFFIKRLSQKRKVRGIINKN